VQVERVPVERILDSPMTSRYDGDTLVIPVMEEVLLIEKSCSSKRKYASPNMQGKPSIRKASPCAKKQ